MDGLILTVTIEHYRSHTPRMARISQGDQRLENENDRDERGDSAMITVQYLMRASTYVSVALILSMDIADVQIQQAKETSGNIATCLNDLTLCIKKPIKLDENSISGVTFTERRRLKRIQPSSYRRQGR